MKTLTLFDGTQVELGKKSDEEDISTSFSPAPPADIRLEDLPAEPRFQTVVCSVLSYMLIGIRPPDIALALDCTEQQIRDIMESEAYTKTHQMVMDSFAQGQQHAARDIISGHAIQAATTLTRALHSKSESNRMRASELILDRAGVSNTGSDAMSEGLVIRVVKDTKTDITIKVG